MSIIKFLSSVLYTPPVYTVSLDSITLKLDGYQNALENLGFMTNRADHAFYSTPTVTLTATRDNVIVQITADVTGHEDVSYSLQYSWFSDIVSLHLTNFDQALTIIGPMKTATHDQEKKIA